MQLFESSRVSLNLYGIAQRYRWLATVFGFYFECVANPYMSWCGLDWTRPRLGHLSCPACHVCLCNPCKLLLLLLLQLGLLLAYANARHCYCDSFLQQLAKYVCQMWFAYNVSDTKRGCWRGYSFGMPFSRTALRYFCPALVCRKTAMHFVPHSGMYECALATPALPPPLPLLVRGRLVICQLCDRQTKHSVPAL